MHRLGTLSGLCAAGLLLFSAPAVLCARADAAPSVADACLPAIAAAERQVHLPPKLLDAIALVESGRLDPATGRIKPWPWSINADGVDHVYATKAEAIAAVRQFQAQGVRSIDVGCMQISLLHHPDAFASLDEAFDPAANAAYGARFLASLYRQMGSWPLAAAAYHSQTPDIGRSYASRVMAIWPLAARFGGAAALGQPIPVAIDYSKYTPAFAASLRRQAQDRARLNARFGGPIRLESGPITPARDRRAARRQPSAWRG